MNSTLGEDENEGLFSKRSSSNILSDPRILQHLRIVAQEAHRESIEEEDESDEAEIEHQKRELYTKINGYNKRNQLGAFKIVAKENLSYEGALRFYFEDGGKELTKAVRLTNSTTVKELLPTLVEKFKPGLENELVPFAKLYAVQEEDELCLDQTEWPLVFAVNASKALRFILRINKPGSESNMSNNTAPVHNGKYTSTPTYTDGAPGLQVGRIGEKPGRPMSGVHDFMYAGRDKSIKMTANSKYEPKSHLTPKNKKNGTLRSRGKTLGSVLRLPKKDRSSSRNTELSTNQMVPDVLKVFSGGNISQDAQYKSVKANTSSMADSIVRQALGKYKLEDADPSDYVLCDVVGHFRKKPAQTDPQTGKPEKGSEVEWVSEYARVIGEKEKPLVLQSLWKPAGNRSRRFELHRRGSAESIPGKEPPNGITRKKAAAHTPSDLSMIKKKLSVSSNDSDRFSMGSPRPSVRDDDSVSQSNLTFNMSTAVDVPYLLLLRGSGITEDYLLHRLDDDVLSIGRPFVGQKHPDIPLYSDDIQSQHCQIYKKLIGDNNSVVYSEDSVDQIYLEPFIGCEVCVNGRALSGPVELRAGDLVQIGKRYLFLYKDPVHVPDVKLVFDWLPNSGGQNGQDLQGRAEVVQMRKISNSPNRLSLVYDLEEEDKLLEFIGSICESVKDGDFVLIASYLFILSIEHSAKFHSPIDTRRLIMKITNVIQAVAWDKTKGITETNVEGETDPLKSLNDLAPDLKLILFWMNNALEMLHFLQDNLAIYLPNSYPTNTNFNDLEEEALANADEELLNVLEEVAMFTFQQTVYHLTKVLYVALPLILDTNPFQKLEDDDNRDDDDLEGADVVVQIFQIIFDLVTSYSVHHQIIRQLFAYLFFFTNASLFNTLMDRGAGGKFYRWAKGAQIRGNLDLLEGWALDVGLQEEAADYLKKLSSAADILATPKVQLLQSPWLGLRHDFPVLNAAQLHKILTEYQVGAGKIRPAEWRPVPEDVDSALKDEEILESFSTHPPFLFPTTDYELDLDGKSPHPVVSKALDALMSSFGSDKGNSEDDTGRATPQISVQTPEERRAFPRFTSASSVKSSPAGSVLESPTKPSQKFSSSDPTLNHIDNNVMTNRLKSQVNGMTKSVSLDNLSSSARKPGKGSKLMKSNSARQKPQPEVPPSPPKDPDDDDTPKSNDGRDDVFVVELDKGEAGIGVGLIDGLFTPLKSNGIYVRTLLPSGPASKDGRLKLGDRILAVNGTSLVGADYHSAMKLIRTAGNRLTFLVAKSDRSVALKITTSTC